MYTRGDTVRVRGFSGVACRFQGYAQEWAPGTDLVIDEDGEEIEMDSDDPELGEWVDDESMAIVVMVGDDAKHTVPIDALSPISAEEFCDGCGQIGCGHSSAREA